MDSGFGQLKQQTNKGLSRFSSAPPSVFASFLEADGPLSPETENVFATFISTMGDIPENSALNVKQETDAVIHQNQPSSKKPEIDQNCFGYSTSMMKNGHSSALTKHSSSPADFFHSILDINNGFGISQRQQTSSTSGDAAPKRFRTNEDNNYIINYSRDGDSIMFETFSNSETQSAQGLVHHLSLPSNSSLEKMLHFQDADIVHCKIRAKRGFATHPRSIAERVRRSKISERMRKLQDVVPNMEKQTNTAEMLDLAVDYIKHLEKQLKSLNEKREKCTCPCPCSS